MRYLTAQGHTLLDVILGVVLIFAPNLFGYNGTGAVANMSRILGVILILGGLISSGGFGLVKQLVPTAHYWLDVIIAVVLFVSPWITGQSNHSAHFWAPQLVIAGLILAGLALTKVGATSR